MADAVNPLSALAEKMKADLSADEQKLLDKLVADAEAFAKAADSDGDGKPDAAGLKALFHKNGEFSKTSLILVLSWLAGLGMWLVQGLAHGMTIPVLGLTIPPFDASAALTMLGASSSLYFANHNLAFGKATVAATSTEK
jgi:hypothetical protein